MQLWTNSNENVTMDKLLKGSNKKPGRKYDMPKVLYPCRFWLLSFRSARLENTVVRRATVKRQEREIRKTILKGEHQKGN